MDSKAKDKFHLVFDVDLVSMTAIVNRNGKQGRTYDAAQYFQYFVEYGVRKADVAQLQEHFSIDHFQNLLVSGKDYEIFEFCVKFVGEDYKILQCKMKVEEGSKSNIKISLEDISYKRVPQLVYIKNHFLQQHHKSEAKFFDITFEEKKDTFKGSQRIYKGLIVAATVICILLSVALFTDIYSQNMEKAEEATVTNCKNTKQSIQERLDCAFINLNTFENILSDSRTQVTEESLIRDIRNERSKYDYVGIAFVDENNDAVLTDETMGRMDIEQMVSLFEYRGREQLAIASNYIKGNILVNCMVPIENLSFGDNKVKLMMASFNLNKLCDIVFDSDVKNQDTIIINGQGDILWSNRPQLTPMVSQHNLFDYLRKYEKTEKSEEWLTELHKNLEDRNSGTFSFQIKGRSRFAAYTPIGIENLYVISISKQEAPGAQAVRTVLLAMAVWLLLLIIPIMAIVMKTKRIDREKERLEEIAYSDSVTGGKNINYFNERARQLIRTMECYYALVVTNLTEFSLYNEKYGHVRGDEIIRRIFMGVSKFTDEEELVCRAYAEHMFALVKFEGEKQLEERLEAIGKSIIDTNFKLEFGVCVIRDCTMDLEVAKERANLALGNQISKEINNITIYYYDVHLLEKLMFKKELENTMYSAFRKNEFKLFVEPIYNLKTRALANGDAYAVWNHPEKGALEPCQYVPVFEQRGLIMCLDSFIFEEICIRIKDHLEKGRSCLPVTIKLHRNHFNVNNFIEKFVKIKERYDIPGECLCFEISEEVMYEKRTQIVNVIKSIHKMGAKCILGEYKGSFVSMEMLYKLNINTIKFSAAIFDEKLSVSAITAIVDLGKAMSANVIATGIGTQKQVTNLLKTSCDEAKGDAFAKNISLDEYINIF